MSLANFPLTIHKDHCPSHRENTCRMILYMSVGSLCSPALQQSTTQGYSRHCKSPEHVLGGSSGAANLQECWR